LGADNNALVALLAINLVGYVILGLLKVIFYLESLPLEQFYNQIFYPLTLQRDWFIQPWSLLTYNWVHDGFGLLFVNMLGLSVFSYVMQLVGANKHIFPIYFYSGFIGGIVFLCIGANQPLIGANASITGLVLASVALAPNYKCIPSWAGGFPFWILGLAFLLLQGYIFLDASIAVDLAMITGGLMGWVYIYFLKRGKDLGNWMHRLLHYLNNSLSPKN
jgi:membrane associated rhomboid family serine protease